MERKTMEGFEWRQLSIGRERRVDASKWREFVFLSAGMTEVSISVLVPKGEPATKILAKKSRRRVR